MTAILIPTSSEQEWLAARRDGVTASEIAIIMGLSPYSSPYALYHQKLGNLPATEQSDVMELGTYMEGFVAAKFAERHPEFQITGDGRTLYAHPDRPWQMATPDRLAHEAFLRLDDGGWDPGRDPVAVLETKIDGGSDEWGDDGTDEIPVHYRCQVLQQCDVLGVDAWFIACLLWQKRKVRIYHGTIDDQARADIEILRSEAQAFRTRLATGDEPDVDWRPATRDAIKHLHPDVEDRDVEVRRQLVISYRAALRRYKQAEQRKDELTNRMLAAIGTGRRAVDCHTREPVATRSVFEQREHVRRATTVTKLTPAKQKKEVH